MRKLQRLLVTFALSISVFAAVNANKSADLELISHLNRQSDYSYKKYIANLGGCIKKSSWQTAIRRGLKRLVTAADIVPNTITYCIIKDTQFNAGMFPTGQMVIHSGTLKILAKKFSLKTNRQREEAIVGLLSHELAHYIQKHSYRLVKASWQLSKSKRVDLKKYQFSQEMELEADQFGYFLLQKARYSTSSLINTLKIIHEKAQICLEKNLCKGNFYFSTHPTSHKRLSELRHKKQDYHKWAHQLEEAINNINLGRQLFISANHIRQATKKLNGSTYLEQAYALALHKIWLKSVPINQQKFRSILHTPAFQDLLISKEPQVLKGPKRLVGNRGLYLKALKQYEIVFKKTNAPSFLANYSVLLSYSPQKEKERRAKQIISNLVKAKPSMQSANNYCVIHYMIGEKKHALTTLEKIATYLEKRKISKWFKQKSNIESYQFLNEDFIFSDFSPVLNLALMYGMLGKLKKAKQWAKTYLKKYESTSTWAKHLAMQNRIAIQKREAMVFEVESLKAGSSLKKILEIMGKARKVSQGLNGSEIWYYEKNDIKFFLHQGTVTSIEIGPKSKLAITPKLKIGLDKTIIEKNVKISAQKSGIYRIYQGQNNLAIYYVNDISNRIFIY